MAEQKTSDNCADVYRIKAVPKGKPTKDDNFELAKGEKLRELSTKEGEGEVLIETQYISVDPYQRNEMKNWFNEDHKQMISFTIAKVLKANKASRFKKGDIVSGVLPWSTKLVLSDSKLFPMTLPPDLSQYKPDEDDDNADDSKFDTNRIKEIPFSYYIGAYGMPGTTAYYGMIYRGKLKKGMHTVYMVHKVMLFFFDRKRTFVDGHSLTKCIIKILYMIYNFYR